MQTYQEYQMEVRAELMKINCPEYSSITREEYEDGESVKTTVEAHRHEHGTTEADHLAQMHPDYLPETEIG